MQLLDIQRRFVEIGRLRLGEKVSTGRGGSRPKRLETWRITSPNKDLIVAAAGLWGGTVEAWEEQYQVITEATSIPVMLPPFGGSVRPYSLYYELWSGGGCTRRCDGHLETISGEACVCDPDARECKPTLRVPFFLPDLPGLGTFRLETGGYNAAAELPGMLDLLSTWAQPGARYGPSCGSRSAPPSAPARPTTSRCRCSTCRTRWPSWQGTTSRCCRPTATARSPAARSAKRHPNPPRRSKRP